MAEKTRSERILECIESKDLEGLKEIRAEIGREKWLNQWDGKSVPPEAWLNNPFVEFK